jgi:hypothetical protein
MPAAVLRQPTLFEFANDQYVAGLAQRRAQEAALERRQEPPARALHVHSLQAMDAKGEALRGRKAAIQEWLRENGPATDRQVLRGMFPGSDDMNMVRPRITELVVAGLCQETGEVEDPDTHCTVRLVRAKSEMEVRLEG